MRFFWLACVVLTAACGTRNQTIIAPCVGKPATGALGECPSCQVDSDCELLSNLCEQTAYCVHKDSSWMVNMDRTCTEKQAWLPPKQFCKCLGNICDWRY